MGSNLCRITSAVFTLVLLLPFLLGVDESGPATPTPAPGPAGIASPVSGIGTALPPSFAAGARAAVIRVEGLIYDFTLESLQRRIDRAVADGATVIVLELNTPGGVVTSALKISKYVKTLQVPTVAWVNPEAYSAGIMIAAACDMIVMAPAAATGDCAPIVPGQELAETERAKALTPILEEFRDSARANGYDYSLFHAMCVLGVELYYIENAETGEKRLVNQYDYKVMVGGASVDEAIEQARRGVQAGTAASGGGAGGASADLAFQAGAARPEVATDEQRGRWKPIEQLPSGAVLPKGRFHDGTTLLTLNQTRAGDIGLSRSDRIRTLADLQTFLAANAVVVTHTTWSEGLAGYLVHPVARMILIGLLLLGAYVEYQAPGTFIGGTVALLALVILLGAPFIVGLAEVWHLLAFLVGFVLLMIELFVTPGFGVLGVLGILLMLTGLVLAVVPTTGSGPMPMPAPQTWDMLQQSILFTLIGFLAGGIGFMFLARHFGSIPGVNRLILRNPTLAPVPLGPDGQPLSVPVQGDEAIGGGTLRVGTVGRVTSFLRPIGRAEFNGRLADVVSDGQWIEPGREVRIVEVAGNRVLVEPA